MNVRLRTLLLILLIGFGSFQMAEARDPRVNTVKPGKYANGKQKPSQSFRTAQAPKKVKYKKFKKAKQKKLKQAKFKTAKSPKNHA
jgi:hypothetical protein